MVVCSVGRKALIETNKKKGTDKLIMDLKHVPMQKYLCNVCFVLILIKSVSGHVHPRRKRKIGWRMGKKEK